MEWAKTWLALGKLLILQFLDVVSTNQALARGSQELNPIIALAQTELGAAWWLPKLAVSLWVLVLALMMTKRKRPLPHKTLVAITAFYTLVVLNNFLGSV